MILAMAEEVWDSWLLGFLDEFFQCVESFVDMGEHKTGQGGV